MKKKPGKRIMNVGVAALARETGLAEGTISQKMKRGATADDIRAQVASRQGNRILPGKRRVPQKPTTSEYEMIVESRARFEEMERWKMRRQKALAERQETENMLRRGELMPVAYARLWGVRFLIAAKDELLKGPGELQDIVAAEADPLKCHALMRAWVERALAKLQQLDQLWDGSAAEQQEVA